MGSLSAVGEEISAAGCSLLLIVVSPAIAGSIIARHATPEQKERWLRGIGAGTTKLAFAITESDAGTNSHNLKTSLEQDGGKFKLNGQKTYISGVEDADAVLVVARGRNDDGSLGLPSLAIVDVDAPGFTRDVIPMPRLGPDKQWTLFFDDVEIEEERLIGGYNGGLGPVFDGLNPERIMGASLATGIGRYAIGRGADYARERKVWNNAPIGTHQGISHPLAQAKIELELARLMTQKAAALYDAGAKGAGEASNMAKYAAAEASIQLRRPGDPDPRRQRLRARVRPRAAVVGRARGAHRARVPRDGPQLRGRALARPPEVLLSASTLPEGDGFAATELTRGPVGRGQPARRSSVRAARARDRPRRRAGGGAARARDVRDPQAGPDRADERRGGGGAPRAQRGADRGHAGERRHAARSALAAGGSAPQALELDEEPPRRVAAAGPGRGRGQAVLPDRRRDRLPHGDGGPVPGRRVRGARAPRRAWMRMRVPLIEGEETEPRDRVLVAADSGNGVSAPLDYRRWLFINAGPDASRCARPPRGEWVCLDATTWAEPDGIGLTDTALYDEDGLIGRATQSLLVAER